MSQTCRTSLFRNSTSALYGGCRGPGSCHRFDRFYASEVHRALAAESGRTGIPLMPTRVNKVLPEELFSQLAQLESEAARRKFLTRHPALVHAEIVDRLAPHALERARVHTRAADPLSEPDP